MPMPPLRRKKAPRKRTPQASPRRLPPRVPRKEPASPRRIATRVPPAARTPLPPPVLRPQPLRPVAPLRPTPPLPRPIPVVTPPPEALPELLPMPGSAVLCLAFGWASLPLALTGPAGVVAGLFSLGFRARFRSVEAAQPGHRGKKLVARIPGLVATAIGVGLVVTGALLWWALSSTTAVPAK